MAITETTKYICLFHHRDHAAAALRDLEKAGIDREKTTVIAKSDEKHGTGYNYNASEDLASMDVPAKDLKHLQSEINDGGVVIIVDEVYEQGKTIEKIFHEHAAGKIDETDVQTKTYDEPEAYVAPVAAARVPAVEQHAVPTSVTGGIIPIVEEELVVGKREVDRGGVRVFSRTVAVPVSESVTLHEEHAVIERRIVDRPVTDADFAMGDQVIELNETAEEAVVGKSARVVEEVMVGKVGSDRTETITDSVRHTEVDVEPVETFETVKTTKSQTY